MGDGGSIFWEKMRTYFMEAPSLGPAEPKPVETQSAEPNPAETQSVASKLLALKPMGEQTVAKQREETSKVEIRGQQNGEKGQDGEGSGGGRCECSDHHSYGDSDATSHNHAGEDVDQTKAATQDAAERATSAGW